MRIQRDTACIRRWGHEHSLFLSRLRRRKITEDEMSRYSCRSLRFETASIEGGGAEVADECSTDLLHEFRKNVGESLARFEQFHLHLADSSVSGAKEVCTDVDGVYVGGAGLEVDTGLNDNAQAVA